MSHFGYARPQAMWTQYAVPVSRDLGHWDRVQYKALAGDAGGSFAPTSPIVLGGSGVILNGAGNLLQGTKTLRGGRMNLGASDYVILSVNRSRTEVMPLYGALPDHGGVLGVGGTANELNVLGATRRGISPISALGDFIVQIPSRYLHTGANLAQAALTCRALVRQPTAQLSAPYFMTAQLFGMNATNTISSPLVPTFTQWASGTSYPVNSVVVPGNSSTAQTGFYYVATAVAGSHTSAPFPPTWPTAIGLSVVDNPGANQINWRCEGYAGIAPAPSTGPGNSYAGGAVQTLTMSPETTFPIDTTGYDYYLQVTYDVFGSGTVEAPNWLFHSLALTFSGISDMHPE